MAGLSEDLGRRNHTELLYRRKAGGIGGGGTGAQIVCTDFLVQSIP